MFSHVLNENTYPTSDVTTCVKSAIYILQILRITSQLKGIVYYRKRPIGLFFHTLSNKTIKYFVANTLQDIVANF